MAEINSEFNYLRRPSTLYTAVSPNKAEENVFHPDLYNYENTVSKIKIPERLSSVLVLNLEN